MKNENFVIGVDPGLRGCGVGLVLGGIVVGAAYVKNSNTSGRGPSAWVKMAEEVSRFVNQQGVFTGGTTALVQEVMKVYPRQKGDAADLLELNGVNGAIAASLKCDTHIGYFAREWKGQVPKDIHNARIELKLTPEEKARIVSTPSLRHNVLDAIGIAFYYIGR